jgi:hypothetical protein
MAITLDKHGTPIIPKEGHLPQLADPSDNGGVYYHGTSKEDKASILKNGINTGLSKKGSEHTEAPDAFYMGGKEEADMYGSHHVGIRVKKGHTVKTLPLESQEWADTVGRSTSGKEAASARAELKKRGYHAVNHGDEIEVLDHSHFEAFDPDKKTKRGTSDGYMHTPTK